MLSRLHRSHADMQAAVDRLVSLLDADTPDAEALAQARWELGSRIMQHVAIKDRHLLANFAVDLRPRVAALAARFRDEFAQHLAGYVDYSKHWTAERALAEWAAYRIAARDQLRLLRHYIDTVERELFPLVDPGAIDTRGRPSASWTRDAFTVKESIAPRH